MFMWGFGAGRASLEQGLCDRFGVGGDRGSGEILSPGKFTFGTLLDSVFLEM